MLTTNASDLQKGDAPQSGTPRGFTDGVEHDCTANGCVLADDDGEDTLEEGLFIG